MCNCFHSGRALLRNHSLASRRGPLPTPRLLGAGLGILQIPPPSFSHRIKDKQMRRRAQGLQASGRGGAGCARLLSVAPEALMKWRHIDAFPR